MMILSVGVPLGLFLLFHINYCGAIRYIISVFCKGSRINRWADMTLLDARIRRC